MIDREHVFGLRNEAGEGTEDIAGVRRQQRRRQRQRQLSRRASAVGLNVPGGSKGDDSRGVELHRAGVS